MSSTTTLTPTSPKVAAFMSRAASDLGLSSLPAPKDIFSFGGNQPSLTAKLNTLALAGAKTATTSYPVPSPIHWGVNDLSVGLDENSEPAFIMRTTWLEECNFEDVPDEFAVDEAEGSAEEWREGHVKYYNEEEGGTFGDGKGKRVLMERFEIIWPLGVEKRMKDLKRSKLEAQS
jgi:uncharacterized protein YhfF